MRVNRNMGGEDPAPAGVTGGGVLVIRIDVGEVLPT
jgi:hypothetical protein